MPTPRYGVLLVTGSHTHQENYAQAFAADQRCRLIAVTDEANVSRRRRQLNEQLARQLRIPHIDDLTQALRREDVDIVSICAPPERRARIAVQCARAGKHLYLDKSLAPSVREADAIVEAVQRGRVKSHMFSFIAQPWAQHARMWVEGNRLGRLVAIHADTYFAKGRTGTARLGRRRSEEFPPRRHQLLDAKREMDNIAVYPLTLIRWLTRRAWRSVHCVTANYFFQEHQRRNVEDFALLTCTMERGVAVTVTCGRFGWTSHPSYGVNRLILVGTQRSVLIDAHRPRLEVYTDQPPWTPPAVHREDPMGFWSSTMQEVHMRPKETWVPVLSAASDVAYFLDRLDAGRDSELNAAEAAQATEVLVAGYRSAHLRQVVTVPLPRN